MNYSIDGIPPDGTPNQIVNGIHPAVVAWCLFSTDNNRWINYQCMLLIQCLFPAQKVITY